MIVAAETGRCELGTVDAGENPVFE